MRVGAFLLSAATTPWPQVSFRISQVLRYTFPSLPHTGPSRSAPVQLSGHTWPRGRAGQSQMDALQYSSSSDWNQSPSANSLSSYTDLMSTV